MEYDTIKKWDSYVELLKGHLSLRGYKNFSYIECSIEDTNLKNLFEQSDFIIVNSECYSSTLFHKANKLAIETGKPWISVYSDGSLAVIGPIYVPGETLCYNEFEIQVEACIKHRDEYILYKDYMEEKGIGTYHFVIPPILNIISSYAAIFTTKFLLTRYSALNERAIFIQFEDLSIDYQNVFRLPRCPACGDKVAYKHSFV